MDAGAGIQPRRFREGGGCADDDIGGRDPGIFFLGAEISGMRAVDFKFKMIGVCHGKIVTDIRESHKRVQLMIPVWSLAGNVQVKIDLGGGEKRNLSGTLIRHRNNPG